jgi:hypothetical protein
MTAGLTVTDLLHPETITAAPTGESTASPEIA